MKLHISACLVSFSLCSGSAHAVLCDPPGAAHTAGMTVIATLSTKLAAMQAIFIETLQLMTGQLTANIQALPAAMAKITGAQTQALSQISQENAETQVVRDFTPSLSSCQNLTLAQQAAAVEPQWQHGRTQLNQQSHRYAQQLTVTAGSLSQAVQARYSHRLEQYCGDEDIALGLCKKKTVNADADILTGESLLNIKTLATPPQQQAAFAAAHLLVKPIPSEPLRKTQVQTLAGQEAYPKQKSREARYNLAHNVFSTLMAHREPLIDSGWMQAILKAQGQTVTTLPLKLSRHEFTDLEVQRRYENPQWYLDVQRMEPAETQRQLLHMLALLLQQINEQNKFLEQIAALQATQLAMTIEAKPLLIPAQTAIGGAH